jgi:hypothetical protein
MFRLSTIRSCSGLRDHSSRVIFDGAFPERRKLNCQEIVMLHRMTTLLSTVVVAFLAAPVLNAAFATAARAAVNCLATPTDNPSEGSRWYYQTNPVTGQKCWIIDGGKATVRHGARRSKMRHAIPARSSRIKLVAETPAVVLPRATANANARLLDKPGLAEPVVEPLGRIKPEFSPGSATAEVADENPAPPTFTSRWVNLWEQAHSGDRQPNPPGNSGIDQPAPTVLRDVTNSSTTDDPLFTDDQPLYLNLFVLLASLGGALLLCGLTGGSFLYRRSAPAVRLNLPPLPGALRVAEFDDSSRPSPPDTATPLHASGAIADSRDPDERDWQIAVDALREVGGDQINRDSSRGQRQAEGDQLLTNPFAGLGERLLK